MTSRAVVLIPAYEAQATLADAILSLLPTRESVDILVVDDGSRDPVAGLVARDPRLAALGERLIVLRQEPNSGLVPALNAGLAWILQRPYAYVLRHDSDDLAAPGRIDAQLAFMDANPEIGMSGTFVRTFVATPGVGEVMEVPTRAAGIRRAMARNAAFCHPTWIVRAEVFRAVGPYDPAFRHAEDFEWAWRCIRQAKTANLPEVLLDYRLSPGQVSSRHRHRQILARMAVLWRELRRGEWRCAAGLATAAVSLILPARLRLALRARGV